MKKCNFKNKDTIFYFIKDGFNTEGDMYKFLLTILASVAEMEIEIILERVGEGIEKAKFRKETFRFIETIL